MALFLDMRTYSPAQRNKIVNAVTPLLSKTNPLDSKAASEVNRKYARAVLKKFR